MKHRNSDGIFSAMSIGLLSGVIALSVGGWIANVAKLVDLFGGPVSEMYVARVIGVFVAPLGSVLGFI